jgi:hypothetical protein
MLAGTAFATARVGSVQHGLLQQHTLCVWAFATGLALTQQHCCFLQETCDMLKVMLMCSVLYSVLGPFSSAGAEELERVRQHLGSVLQLALASHKAAAPALGPASRSSSAASAAAAAAALQHPLPIVAQSTAFSGCYQLVFELVRPTGMGGSEQQPLLQLASAVTGSTGGATVQLSAGQTEADLAEQQLEQLQHFLEQQVRQQLPAGWDVRGVQMVGKSKKDLPGSPDTAAGAAAEAAGSGGKAAKECSSSGRRHSAHPKQQAQQLTAVATAAAANSLAAALACLWSREGDGQKGGIYLQPLAAALPEAEAPTAAAAAAADSSAASLGSGSSSNRGVVEVELLLSKELVEQLLEQGHERVRCVVAVQPQGAVLLDQV